MVDQDLRVSYIGNVGMKFLVKRKKIRKLINSDNAIDVSVDVMLIVFDVLSSPILMVVRVLRYAFNKFIRGYVIKGIKWILSKIMY
tara:strand:+ start:145 stop:402 length:258 start_codon:yes stop_codon:yes gene_type:complete